MEIMAVNLPSSSSLPPSPCAEDSGFPLASLDSEDYVFVEARHPNKVLEGLNSLRLNKAFCDVTLCCGGQEFPCHRIVLASFSSYFQVRTSLTCWTCWRCARPAAASWSARWTRSTAWASTASPRRTRAGSWSDAAWSTSSSTSAASANRFLWDIYRSLYSRLKRARFSMDFY